MVALAQIEPEADIAGQPTILNFIQAAGRRAGPD